MAERLRRVGAAYDLGTERRKFNHIEVYVQAGPLRVCVTLDRPVYAHEIAAFNGAFFLNLLVRSIAPDMKTTRRIGRREPNNVVPRETLFFRVRLAVLVDAVAVDILKRKVRVGAGPGGALGEKVREIGGGLPDQNLPKRTKLALRVGFRESDGDKILRVRLPGVRAGFYHPQGALRVFGLRLVDAPLY